MQIDFSQVSPQTRYKLLIGTIVPRPIAWITSLHADGRINVAPFSFFNVLGSDRESLR